MNQEVEMKDKSDKKWKVGQVSSLFPLKAVPEQWNEEHTWDCIRVITIFFKKKTFFAPYFVFFSLCIFAGSTFYL